MVWLVLSLSELLSWNRWSCFFYSIFRETLANRSSYFLCLCRFHAVVCLICLNQLFRFLTTLSLSSSAPILWSRPTIYSTAMQYFVSNAIFVFFVLRKIYWPCLHLRWWYGVGLTTELSCITLSQSPLSSVSFYEEFFFFMKIVSLYQHYVTPLFLVTTPVYLSVWPSSCLFTIKTASLLLWIKNSTHSAHEDQCLEFSALWN